MIKKEANLLFCENSFEIIFPKSRIRKIAIFTKVLDKNEKTMRQKLLLKTTALFLASAFLFFGATNLSADVFQEGLDAAEKGDYAVAFEKFKPIADQGWPGAQFNLGVMYAKGQGVQKSYKEALKWYLLAAKQGNASAQSNLGNMYEKGQGTAQDYNEALKWYNLAANQGHGMAQTNLGNMYYSGKGVEQDYKEALKWYLLAAENGRSKAQFKIGVLYAQGEGVSQDYIKAHKWFNISGANGNELGRNKRNSLEKLMTARQISKAQKLARKWLSEHNQ